MPDGLQVFNDTGSFQIDGENKSFILVRKVSVTTTVRAGNDWSSSQGRTPINLNEIVALRSSVYSAVVTVTGGQLVVVAQGEVGQVVDCYFFAPITTSAATEGLQVFNSPGELIFCASLKNLRMSGFASGNGDFVYDGGRQYAALMLTQKIQVNYGVFSPVAGVIDYNYIQSRGMIKSIPGGISSSLQPEFVDVGSVSGGQSPPQYTNANSIADSAHIAIDVTNY